MGKAQIAHKDVLQRINFLYQLSLESLRCSPDDLSLCRFYVATLKSITQKHVLHLHPEMKRSMCKRCCVLLIPGLTAVVRTKKKRQKYANFTCLECGTVRRIVNNPSHIPRVCQPDQWEDRIIDGATTQQCAQAKQAQNSSKRKNKQKKSKSGADVTQQGEATQSQEKDV